MGPQCPLRGQENGQPGVISVVGGHHPVVPLTLPVEEAGGIIIIIEECHY
jgi:hypothetical protein